MAETQNNAVTIRLPVPPSVNAMYANRKNGWGRGRYKTKAYKDWLREADSWFIAQKAHRLQTMTGELQIEIRVPKKTRGDISNRIKAAEDYLVSRLITGDDRHNQQVKIARDPALTSTYCEIVITGPAAADNHTGKVNG